jgi:hypothetical protein
MFLTICKRIAPSEPTQEQTNISQRIVDSFTIRQSEKHTVHQMNAAWSGGNAWYLVQTETTV